MALMEQQGSPTGGSMWGYNDENGSALRKVVMRKRIRSEEFIFLKLPLQCRMSLHGIQAQGCMPISLYH